MKIDILTLFPDMFVGPFAESIVKRAKDKGIVEIKIHNLRDWSEDKHRTVDSPPYGGGAGMVMRIDVIERAVSELKKKNTKVILLDTKGDRYCQTKASELKNYEHLIFICGHYEGLDHRVHEYLADEVISIGDFVLSGGEIPTMAVVDSVVRLLPGALGNNDSLDEESFNEEGEIEYPQYTRPEKYKDWGVPEVLLSGDHKKIKEWRDSKKKSTR